MKKIGITLAILVLNQLAPVFAESATEKMQAYAGNKEVPALLGDLRGGPTTKQPLGFYAQHLKSEDLAYHSGYEKQPAALTGRFANDLYQFVLSQGGGFANEHKDRMTKKMPGHVDYSKQAKFATYWWTKNCPQFPAKDKSASEKWVREALLDGTVLWTMYEKTSLTLPKGKSTDEDKYMDAGRDHYHDETLLSVFKMK